jgi:hypothetical protein
LTFSLLISFWPFWWPPPPVRRPPPLFGPILCAPLRVCGVYLATERE